MNRPVRYIFFLLVIALHGRGYAQELNPPDDQRGYPENFIILAPLVMVGPTSAQGGLSNGISSSSSLSYSAGIAGFFFVFRPNRKILEGEYDRLIGPILEASLHSEARDFVISRGLRNSIRVNYLNLMPGVNWNRIATFGVNIGIPLRATSTVPLSSNTEAVTTLNRSSINLLIAPEVMLAMPLVWFHEQQQAMILFMSVDYPFNHVFNSPPAIVNGSGQSVGTLGTLRFFEFQAGISFAFEITTSAKEYRYNPNYK